MVRGGTGEDVFEGDTRCSPNLPVRKAEAEASGYIIQRRSLSCQDLIEQDHVVRDHVQEEDEDFVLRQQEHTPTESPLSMALAGAGSLAEADEDLPLAAVVVTEDADLADGGRQISRISRRSFSSPHI